MVRPGSVGGGGGVTEFITSGNWRGRHNSLSWLLAPVSIPSAAAPREHAGWGCRREPPSDVSSPILPTPSPPSRSPRVGAAAVLATPAAPINTPWARICSADSPGCRLELVGWALAAPRVAMALLSTTVVVCGLSSAPGKLPRPVGRPLLKASVSTSMSAAPDPIDGRPWSWLDLASSARLSTASRTPGGAFREPPAAPCPPGATPDSGRSLVSGGSALCNTVARAL